MPSLPDDLVTLALVIMLLGCIVADRFNLFV